MESHAKRGRALSGLQAIAALLAACLVFALSASAAWGQIGADLVPEIPPVEAPAVPILPLPSPSATEAAASIGDLETQPPELAQVPGLQGVLGGGEEVEPGGSGGATGGGGSSEGSGEGSTAPTGGSAVPAPATTTLPQGPQESAPAPIPEISFGTAAGRAAVAAAGRAIDLAGPLAPPLVLAAIVLAIMIGVGRGSEHLQKVEQVAGKRTYRL